MFVLNIFTVTIHVLFRKQICDEWNLNVSTVQFVVQNKEIIHLEKHLVEIKEDSTLVVTIQRWRQEGDSDANVGDQRVVEFENAER